MPSYSVNNANKSPTAIPKAGPDLIGSILGNFGIWQIRTVLIIFLCKIPASWFMACIIFTAPEIYPNNEFQCDISGMSSNATVSEDQCYINTIDGQLECTDFNYNYDFYSLVMQFDLVCLRDIFVAWTQFWHLFGILVGGVIATKMMLWISPRTTMFIGMVLQIICGCITGFARDFTLHCAFRCLSAACCALMFTGGHTILSDITAGKYRLGVIILYDTFWSIGLFLLPGLASFFRNWTQIYLGITFPTLVLIFLLNWTPDSPRWLLRKAKDTSQCEQIIRDAAKINDRTYKIPVDFSDQLRIQAESLKNNPPREASWVELWTGPRAKTHLIAAHIALAVFIINFMGMLLNIRSFGRDYLVLNTIIMGFSEIVGCFLALHFTLKHNSWKWQLAGGFNIVAGLIGFLGWTFHENSMDDDLKATLWIIIAAIPKAGTSLAQSMIIACLAELVPPHKKVPFMFSVVTWARIWLLTAPFVNVLKKIAIPMSLSAFCLLSIIGGICLCLLLTPRPSGSKITTKSTSENGNTEVEHEPSTKDVNKVLWTVEVYDNPVSS
ncbi:solute carrier family 22 member 13 [Eupeodes corollae]|uniref:solute carrier family 22 member 13 n=1 Tax=Eupeodes corollae TaxID=290404 RepID=UPI0024933D6A|nr:solute carrier family 22 member 13 [Eupeodes corollae]XP_055905943.1 solute carrier family 22 member 13 [Eupeodes corollae]